MKICQNCGSSCPDSAKFCPNCAAPLDSQAPAATVPPAPQQKNHVVPILFTIIILAFIIVAGIVAVVYLKGKSPEPPATAVPSTAMATSNVTSTSAQATSAHTNATTASAAATAPISGNEPFYGIFCSAYKNRSDAQKDADKLIKKGFGARVFVTTDWSNLNDEKWFVVSAGVYLSKEDANAALKSVKKVYSDAYVKYSGNYIGND